MYLVVKTLIDDVLMGPTLAPFTTVFMVLFIALNVVAILTGAPPPDDLATEDDDEDDDL